MDVQVIDVQAVGHRGMADDGDGERSEGGEVNNAENPQSHDEEGEIPEPYVGMEFHSERCRQDSSCALLRPRRHFAGAAKNVAEAYQGVGIVPSGVIRRRTLGKDAQNLLEYFKKMQAENPGFFMQYNLMKIITWVTCFGQIARSRTAYSHFGDAVTLDTTYRVNQYRSAICSIYWSESSWSGTILFGCALLLDESEASFNWLFKTFLTAMNDCPPVSIMTDQDRAIQTAVSQCFQKFATALASGMNNDWLQSLYSARAQWVPVYFRDSFFAAISPNQGYEGSFFDGYVNQQTTLPMFFRQYERALENWFEREVEADFDTICTTPVLRTPSPMEKQAANLYTRKIFAKFQEELVETFVYTANRIEGDGAISTFRVAKFEDDHKAYIVTLNYPEMRANCSCQLFEYSGILCRHVLTVFTVTNVLTLPSHYILKRWTRNAKNVTGIEERSGDLHDQESLTLRYNSLCREAIRYAEDGATTTETYNAAMIALRDGGKKVSNVKRNVAKVTPPSSQVTGTGYEEKKNSTSNSDMTPFLWPRQDEVMRRFNLNDAGAPAQAISDLNLPRMAPVSLLRDDGTPENMVVLPHLKSMTWVMENKNSAPGNRVAVINLKLQDYSRTPSAESEVKFQLSRVSLEPMLRSMAYISDQLSTPANKVAVINLKLQDTETTTGESEVKFQVSRDTLGAMLRSMAYIREQLSNVGEVQSESQAKKQRK
ncbi:hypothetical protein M0R45_035556 [Rubus argutus]|uniref:Protein FAR1-RELATED SEQUENCE n=1 Tax=Rubus argutus TaxID=59490 RepID=A0AAW1VV88_RUBAR